MKNSSLLHPNPKLTISKILNPTYPSPKKKQGACRSARFSNSSDIFKNVEELKYKLSVKEKKLTSFTKKMTELQNLNKILISVAKKSSKNEELISQMDRTIESLKSSERNLIEELEEQKLLLSELLKKFENYQEQGINEKAMLREYYKEYFLRKMEDENRQNLAKIRVLEEENKLLKEKQNLKFYAEEKKILREKIYEPRLEQDEKIKPKKISKYYENESLNILTKNHERKILGQRKNVTEFSGEKLINRNSKYDHDEKKILTAQTQNSFIFLDESRNEEDILRQKRSLGVLEEKRKEVSLANKENSKIYQEMIGKSNLDDNWEKPSSMKEKELYEEIKKIKMDLRRLERKK